ncbi:Qat anti-phage system TatD family nuclease QatD [Lysobacter panacisoli]|uniref:Qat anti-phage system TatD family nuclease QatD n=1 Tax=Lysobacter panacisoli TaxID=1255263 RepID=UPI001E519A42|nr:Qat anti-phage system TatD family nuclease QatD [Lysobacter panacisoli]
MADRRIERRWVDLHCHVDLYPDHPGVIADCDRLGIATLAITTTPRAFERNVQLAAGSPFVKVALGLHPQLVASRSNEIGLFEGLLAQARFVGEIGLDAGSQFYASFPEQQRVFERILRACDEQGGKVLSIHSVRSVSKVLGHLERSLRSGSCVPVLHWFTGTPSEARRALAMGCYFSINSEMVSSPKSATLIRSLPLDRVLTETDGPFVQIGGRPSRPTDIPSTVVGLSELIGADSQMLERRILENYGSLTAPAAGHRSRNPRTMEGDLFG